VPVTRNDSEAGFTMIMTVLGLALVASLVAVAVTAVNGTVHTNARDLSRKQAFEAATAGINEYAYHLHSDSGYWTKCTEATGPSALNQKGSTANRRPVPGETGAEYAIELIPNSQTEEAGKGCDPTSVATATATMLETSGAMKGTFRIRATGYAGETSASVTATFKPASFLDYVYFTQLETSDPVTYGSETAIKGAYEQCTKTIEEGRYLQRIPGTSQFCDTISFVSGDNIKGPMHTNDAFVICGEPTLGRNANDPIEVSSEPRGWYSTKEIESAHYNCTGSEKNFLGTFRSKQPVLLPPSTNEELSEIAEPEFRYQGQVRICLSGSTMTVRKGPWTCAGEELTEESKAEAEEKGEKEEVLYSGPLPGNGVVYVGNVSCSGAYSPFDTTYPNSSECGNVYVKGSYTGQLTIAAGNDIVVNGNLTNAGEESVLGLIANNFIRVFHPVHLEKREECHWVYNNGHYESVCEEVTYCSGNANGALSNVQIDAALLAINHSFIVDNYRCGSSLGNLNVRGAIAQKYRGAVGTSGGTGYLKNYEYDERLHTIEPPSFITPVQSDWVIGRETVG
jgi:type II secretory pathway pseudopilin PulG